MHTLLLLCQSGCVDIRAKGQYNYLGDKMSDFIIDCEYLIHLIYCAVHGITPNEKPEGVSFERVFSIGSTHEVANIAFLSVEKLLVKPPDELYNRWKMYYYFSVERDSKQTAEREALLSLVHSVGARTLEAQGTVTKRLYPSREWRMMSDIDFVIDREELEKVRDLLREHGYGIKQTDDYEFTAINKDKMEIEFHTDLFTEFIYNRKERFYEALNSAFDYAVPVGEDGFTFELNDTYYYLYSLLHTVKHFETAGCGIRRILDLYYLKKAYENKVDRDVINEVVVRGGFEKSLETLFAVEKYWFENGEKTDALNSAIKDIIMSGNHGTGELFIRSAVQRDREEGVRLPRLKKILRFVFPTKEYVYLGYPVCRERGYPTVACWLYRIFATLKRFDFSHAFAYIKTVLKSK